MRNREKVVVYLLVHFFRIHVSMNVYTCVLSHKLRFKVGKDRQGFIFKPPSSVNLKNFIGLKTSKDCIDTLVFVFCTGSNYDYST